MTQPLHTVRRLPHEVLRPTAVLLGLGALVGAACWPLNVIDRLQDRLAASMPALSGDPWTPVGLLLAVAPVLVMPLLLVLQRGPWRRGRGSGIPETLGSLEDGEEEARRMGTAPTVQRFLLWSVASLALMPLGREGPVVQIGAAIGHGLRHRLGDWLPGVRPSRMLAIGAGAGLAGGFNTPLMGLVFVAEEITASFRITLVWPTLLVCAMAAWVSDLGGQPMFALGRLNTLSPESEQVLWAIPIGFAVGLVGAGFSAVLLRLSSLLRDPVLQRPLRSGVLLGTLLALLALASGGASTTDGEQLMSGLLETVDDPMATGSTGGTLLRTLALAGARWIGPLLPLAAGIPGGLIDPSLTFGAVLGEGGLAALGADPHLGMALGMSAGLAGATQLPAMAVIFCMRLAADQQLVPGLLVAAVVAAYSARLVQPEPIYHALARTMTGAPQSAPRR
jgi:H+/Cl- antiporter ClcA